MNHYAFTFRGAALRALPSGALWWPDESLLCVSDLHFGKSERVARRTGNILPPYDGHETLARLDADLAETAAQNVICLGDSFDDISAAAQLPTELNDWLARLITVRDWMWIEGNHDPGPLGLPGRHAPSANIRPLHFRHIAMPDTESEVSGHFHPKARFGFKGGTVSRACFLIDSQRIVMPAYGTYTGGLWTTDPVLMALMKPDAIAVLTGPYAQAIPMPRQRSHPRNRTLRAGVKRNA
ncbi:ligase-associated DNA damage response endonuclease PdeM [Rhodobacteraceae bacterium SC52]|nr:ligase-associated DNA damage response endonuclease PdeM [Rhodobacteraceae bacterium SC52]